MLVARRLWHCSTGSDFGMYLNYTSFGSPVLVLSSFCKVEDIPLHELKDLIAQAQRLIDPTKVEKAATEDPEVLELFGESEDGSNRNGAEDHGHNGNECNAGNAGGNAEAGFAFSTSGEVIEDASWRSRSEARAARAARVRSGRALVHA